MIEARAVEKRYGGRAALSPTTLRFDGAATTVLVGPSGCGKTTLLRVLVGLVDADAGEVSYDGERLTKASAERIRQRIGFVQQDGGLFPHLTARRNASLLADVLGRPREETARRVSELAELVRLPAGRLDAVPGDLSGGERQRAALLRALMLDPAYVLLDEPLGALDPITRRDLQDELAGIFARLGKTVVLVTHDLGEAAFFGARIVLMREGRVVQEGTIDDLVDRPAEAFVRAFVDAPRTVRGR